MTWAGRIVGAMIVLATAAACTSATNAAPPRSSAAGTITTSPSAPSGTSVAPTTSGPDAATSSSPPGSRTSGLHPDLSRLTPQGFWWAVDSTVAISGRSLDNVHDYNRGRPNPVAWGRYLFGHFALHPGELRFAAAHRIALYVLVPDGNCSGCAGGDACGNDESAAQARHDASHAIDAARRLRLPRGLALFKDLEQVGSCSGQLSGAYVDAWADRVRRSAFRPAFYGNSTAQNYDFPRAYCAAAAHDPALTGHVLLAQDEPEPDIGAGPKSIGPDNAPHFAPKHPHCTTRADIDIWQYGESLGGGNVTDVDEIRPGTPGLLAPDGAVTR